MTFRDYFSTIKRHIVEYVGTLKAAACLAFRKGATTKDTVKGLCALLFYVGAPVYLLFLMVSGAVANKQIAVPGAAVLLTVFLVMCLGKGSENQ